jgi:hypothetical protein
VPDSTRLPDEFKEGIARPSVSILEHVVYSLADQLCLGGAQPAGQGLELLILFLCQ